MTLRELRLSQHLTLAQMGEILGRSHTSLSNYENGKTSIPDEVFTKIEEKFHVVIREVAKEEKKVKKVDPEKLIIGEQLKSHRLSYSLSRNALGKIVGKSASSIMGYEQGLREIPEDVLEKFEEWMASAEKKKQMTGEQLKSLRCSHGLSQAAFGKIIGKHRSTVIDYEKGVRKVPEDVVNKLEGYFGMSTFAGDASPGADCGSDLVKDNPVAPEDLE